MPDTQPRRFWLLTMFSAAAAAVVSACKNAPVPVPVPDQPQAAPAPAVTGPIASAKGSARSSSASSPRAYRQDGATHLYGLNAERIYKGKMPPLLYAIGVLNV